MTIVKRTFSIPEDISHQLDKTIPKQEKPRFVSNTLAEALRERNRQHLIKTLNELEPWENQNDPSVVEVLREIRCAESKELADTVNLA